MLKARHLAITRWTLAAALLPVPALHAQEPAPNDPAVAYRAGIVRAAPRIRVWVVDDSADANATGQPYGDASGGASARHVYYRVSEDAYVTVVALDAGGHVRVLSPRRPDEQSLTSSRAAPSRNAWPWC